ncbi:hypothetical protein [Methylophilus sp. 14]|uniref:hypothetical protein n=1 Tax=Methylophilus sp. 14 TaxID=2781019 RepID=UPI00188F7EA5|nr:hypothetical protein [Methylophilus sp. 14]MBF4989023.1 hypothetical protein [Methylophilus sp. 14]
MALLDDVLKELPTYLGKFTRLLMQPSQLVHDHLNTDDPNALLEQSIAFLLLSFTIALVLAVVFPEMTNPVQLATDEAGMAAHAFAAIRLLFELLGLSALAYLAAKVAGVQSGFQRFFGLMCAACGVMLVIQVFAASLTNISLADPVTAKAWIQLEKGMATLKPLIEQNVLCATDASSGEVRPNAALGAQFQTQLTALQAIYMQVTDRPLFKLAAGLQLLAGLILLIWSARLWAMYLKGHALSTGKLILATVLLVVFTGAGTLVYELVNAGRTMMDLYRHCG